MHILVVMLRVLFGFAAVGGLGVWREQYGGDEEEMFIGSAVFMGMPN